MTKLSSPKQMKILYVLTANPSEKDYFINLISQQLKRIEVCLQNNSIVCHLFHPSFPLSLSSNFSLFSNVEISL